MAVARPYGFEIDFVRNPLSGSAAWFPVIILKFIFTPIFGIKIHEKKFLDTKNWRSLFFCSWSFQKWRSLLEPKCLFVQNIYLIFCQNNFQMVKNLSQMLSSSNSKWSKTDRSGLLLLKTWQTPIFANTAPLVVEKQKKLSSNRNLLSRRK